MVEIIEKTEEQIREELQNWKNAQTIDWSSITDLTFNWRDNNFSYHFLEELVRLEEKYRNTVLEMFSDMKIEPIRKAKVIARFLKDSTGNFKPLTSEEIVKILDQMHINTVAKATSAK